MPGYISEFLHEGGGATDFVEVAVPTGTDTKKRAVKEIKKWDLDLAMHRYEVERLREAEERNQAGMKCVA